MPELAGEQRRIDALVADQQRIVDDRKLRLTPCVRVAEAVLDGRLPASVMHQVLKQLCQRRTNGTLQHEPWMYYVGAMQRAFRERGIPWGKES